MSSYQSSFAACYNHDHCVNQETLRATLAAVDRCAYCSGGIRVARASVHACNFKLHRFSGGADSPKNRLPVAIGSVAGEFSGFNPVLLLSDLQLAIDDSAESPALEFSEARIAVDMGRSIWQRRWVLDEFVIRNLRIDITESADGSWQLSGVATRQQ